MIKATLPKHLGSATCFSELQLSALDLNDVAPDVPICQRLVQVLSQCGGLLFPT